MEKKQLLKTNFYTIEEWDLTPEGEKKLFRLWRRVRDGTLSRKEFQLLVSPIRKRVEEILTQTARFEITSKEKTPWAKTVRTCRQLLKVETALCYL